MKSRSFVLSGVFLLLFLCLILLLRTVDVAPIGPEGTSIGLSGINRAVRDGIGMHPALYKLTQITGYLAILLAAFFAVFGGFQLIQDGETVPEASFPSSHTMLSCVIYLSAAMVLGDYFVSARLSALLRGLCVALAVITVVGRLASGVHWFTDICGGVLISVSLLLCFQGLLHRDDD